MHRFLAALFLLFFAANLGALELPALYEDMEAEDKQAFIWGQIVGTAYDELPSLSSFSWAGVWAKLTAFASLGTTFSHVSDEMPVGRPKIIHTHGAAATFDFIAREDSRYTGLLGSDAKGIIRYSLAGDPASLGSFTPGIGLKYFIDSQPSRNIFAMYSLNGQGENQNPFAHPFTNVLPKPTGYSLRALEKVFSWVKSNPGELSLMPLATINAQGEAVENANAPWKLIIEPEQDVANLIADDSKEDFRDNLALFEAGTTLYTIWGQNEEFGYQYPIGKIVLTSKFVASQFGDEKLFFQHHR